MNKVIQQFCARKFVRILTEQAISPAEKNAILRAAVQAPTKENPS